MTADSVADKGGLREINFQIFSITGFNLGPAIPSLNMWQTPSATSPGFGN
jgi:hypothetical protein